MKGKSGALKLVVLFVMVLLMLFDSSGMEQQEALAKSANRVEFKSSSVSLYVGEYTTIVPTAVYQNGKLMAKAYDGKPIDKTIFSYKSDNTSVATVSSKGVITAKKKGKCKITVTSIYNKKVKGTFKVNVTQNKQKAKITLEKTKATIAVGKTITINVKSYSKLSQKTAKYSSSDKTIATVNSKGKVTGKKAGTATITVTSGVNKNVTAKFKVTVKTLDVIDTKYSKKGTPKITLAETSVTLAPEKSFDGFCLEYGSSGYKDAEKFAAREGFGQTITPAKIMVSNKKKYGTAQIKIKSITGLKSSAVIYKSSNEKVATVSTYGKVTPRKAGTAVITVTSKANKKVTATYTVTVKKLVTSFAFNMYTNLKKQEPDLEAKYTDDIYDWRGVYVYPIPDTAANRKYTLTSSNENVIKVYNGGVAGAGYGTATLTLKSADGFCKYSWKCTVTDNETTCWYNEGFGD